MNNKFRYTIFAYIAQTFFNFNCWFSMNYEFGRMGIFLNKKILEEKMQK